MSPARAQRLLFRLWTDRRAWRRRLARLPGSPLEEVARAAVAAAEAQPLLPLPEEDVERASLEETPLVEILDASLAAHLATAQPAHAHRAVRAALRWSEACPRSDLGKAAQAQWCAAALDLAGGAVPPAEALLLAERLRDLVEAFAHQSRDNPDNPFNNWWAVTHSARGLAARAAEPFFPGLAPAFADAAERVRSYLGHYGDGGHYYEGTGYGLYALSHWGPFLLAARRAGLDLAALSPGLSRLPRLVSALTVPTPRQSDCLEQDPAVYGLGRRAFWNDDGGNAPPPALQVLLCALADPSDRGPLRWTFDRLAGHLGDRGWLRPGQGLLWSLLFYPLETPAADPAAAWPAFLADQRHGLAVFRDRYAGPDDCVFAAYARSWHGGGHRQDDAGSFRFLGLGGEWAQAGGQAKPEPWHQSAIVVDGRQAGPGDREGPPTGKVSYLAPSADGRGGSVSLRLAGVYDVTRVDRHFAVRYPDAASGGGVSAVLGLADQLWDKTERTWAWTFSYGRDLLFQPWPEENGFLLRHPASGSSLAVRFRHPAALAFEDRAGPPSQRTYSSGHLRHYPGTRWVQAEVRALRVDFLAVATLQRGDPPPLSWLGQGLDARAAVAGCTLLFQRGRWFDGPLRLQPFSP